MSLFQTGKPKSAAKNMMTASPQLEDIVLDTLSHISQMVGATLGPGGRHILIERPEIGMRPYVSKDGVTVFKNLGYDSSIKQLILESARDAATRTATEAGDGTTTATILSHAIAASVAEAVRKNNKISPQRIVREMQALVPQIIELINGYKIPVTIDNYDEVMFQVALLSGNGDADLAQSIMEAIELVGDEGNMTIVEVNGSGESRYEAKRINGYTIETGYEQSCRGLSSGFINDKSGTMVGLNNPLFVLFDGVLNDMNQIFDPMSKLAEYITTSGRKDNAVVIVAHGFSDQIIGDFHHGWNHPKALIKMYACTTPETAISSARSGYLYDLQAYTGAPVFNPVDRPLYDLNPESLVNNCRVTKFEAGRFRSTVVATEDVEAIGLRVDELKEYLKVPESELEEKDLNVRIGKLTSGIARLTIYGPTTAETREKRDRAEDSWMAIKGAIKHGACPGGGYVLVKVAGSLIVQSDITSDIAKKLALAILGTALLKPVEVLYLNYGYNAEDISKQLGMILNNEAEVFNIQEGKWVPKLNLLDSVPAVVEAVRNSISIASLLGTLGGIVAFRRDSLSDKEEERFVRRFESAIGERGSVNGNE